MSRDNTTDCRSTNPPSGWRPHTEKPTGLPVTAMIAIADEGGWFLLGIYTYTAYRGCWWDEFDGQRLKAKNFFYRLQDEILEGLPTASTSATSSSTNPKKGVAP